jgi:hypothetical protein
MPLSPRRIVSNLGAKVRLIISRAACLIGSGSGSLLTVKLRHKQPDGGASMTTEHSLDGKVMKWSQAPSDFRFAAAVAQFGMILRDSAHKGNGTLAGVLETARRRKAPIPRAPAPVSSNWSVRRRRFSPVAASRSLPAEVAFGGWLH